MVLPEVIDPVSDLVADEYKLCLEALGFLGGAYVPSRSLEASAPPMNIFQWLYMLGFIYIAGWIASLVFLLSRLYDLFDGALAQNSMHVYQKRKKKLGKLEKLQATACK